MTSVIIAAHNEAAVIGRCLDTLLAAAEPGEFDVTVVANGCRDDTATVARSRPAVRVIEIEVASKPAALNAGDQVAIGFPRIYLDADIVVTAPGIRALAAAVRTPVRTTAGRHESAPTPPAPLAPTAPLTLSTSLAAMPRRELDLSGRPLLVRAYYAINRRLPVYRDGLFGRGVIALSAPARERFDHFPDVIADDLFLDSLFTTDEKHQVDDVSARIATPRTTRDLLRRLARVRAGNAVMRATVNGSGETAVATSGRPAGVRRAARLSWLTDVVLPRPWLAPAAVCYVTITVAAALAARRTVRAGGAAWGRDESSRQG